MTTLQTVPLFSYLATLIAALGNQRTTALVFAGITLGTAMVSKWMDPPAVVAVAALFGCGWWFKNAQSSAERSGKENVKFVIANQVAAFGALLVVSVAFLIRKIPGFQVEQIISPITLGQAAGEYFLRVSLERPLFSVVVLLAGILPGITTNCGEVARRALLPLVATVVAVISTAVALHFIVWDPKVPPGLLLWMLSMFFVTSIAEEIFFRGLIQTQLVRVFGRWRGGAYIGIVAASVLFGIGHAPGGAALIALATIAGIGYGWVYYKTNSILAAATVHTAVNVTHLLFFTYPRAA